MKTFKIYWIAADRQGWYEMGEFATLAEAEAGIERTWEIMHDQGSPDDQEWINAGSMEIDEQSDDDDDDDEDDAG